VGGATVAAGRKGLGGHFDESMTQIRGPCGMLRMLMRTLWDVEDVDEDLDALGRILERILEKRRGECGEARIRSTSSRLQCHGGRLLPKGEQTLTSLGNGKR
jgi:hypothetical protein